MEIFREACARTEQAGRQAGRDDAEDRRFVVSELLQLGWVGERVLLLLQQEPLRYAVLRWTRELPSSLTSASRAMTMAGSDNCR